MERIGQDSHEISVQTVAMKNNWCNDCSAGEFEKVHFRCLPDIGEIQVNGLMVKRRSCFYYLPDSLPMKYAFPAMRGSWFLHVEVEHLKCLCIPCSPCDAAVLSKHKDYTEDKARHNSEEKRIERFQPCAYLVEEHKTSNHVSKKQKKKENSHENYAQNAATGMPERYSFRFGDKPTGITNNSQYVMRDNKVENLVELRTNSIQGSLTRISTQVISVTGIINKYFSGFNGIDNCSSSSNSDVTSRAVRSEIEVHSNTRKLSCSKRQSDFLPQFTPKTPPHVLHEPLHAGLVSKKLRGTSRGSKVGKRILVASQSLGATKHGRTLSFCKFKDKKLLKDEKMNGSIFSFSDSDD
ncbi:uncharacterized protein LOC113853002 [Abrus precatorius]|uniref:Uncharacterized protein LOC113853002 n=1 Tax=Abrus precatorius TaxID=3816 RepID=A0A8B8K646_ABRPR|nr:uncharacterized protein LOC113853002 [Abrus precatorius]